MRIRRHIPASTMFESLESRQLLAADLVVSDSLPKAKKVEPAVVVPVTSATTVQSTSQVNIVATSGQTASAQSLTSRTFLTGFTLVGSGKKVAAQPVYTTYPLGVTATITPVVNADQSVTMAIDATHTQLLSVTTQRVKTPSGWMNLQTPVIQLTKLQTTVTVSDGQTLILNGFLGQDPTQQREAIALVTPRLLSDSLSPQVAIELRFVSQTVLT